MRQISEKIPNAESAVLLTLEEAAEAANCPVSAIRRLIETSKLPVVQLTRKCTRINAADLLKVFQTQRLIRGGNKLN